MRPRLAQAQPLQASRDGSPRSHRDDSTSKSGRTHGRGQPPSSGAAHLRMAPATGAGNARERQRASLGDPQHRRRTAVVSHRRLNVASQPERSCTHVAHLVKIWCVCGMPTRDRVSATASTAQRRATMLAGPPCARAQPSWVARSRETDERVREAREKTFSLETRRSVRL